MSHDPSEINLICWFAAHEIFLIIINCWKLFKRTAFFEIWIFCNIRSVLVVLSHFINLMHPCIKVLFLSKKQNWPWILNGGARGLSMFQFLSYSASCTYTVFSFIYIVLYLKAMLHHCHFMKSVLPYLYIPRVLIMHSIFTSLIFISITVYILLEDMTTCLILYI